MNRRKIILWVPVILLLVAAIYMFPEPKLPEGAEVDKILVDKSGRKLMLYNDGRLLKSYRISIGKNLVGPKQYQGDRKTPEGIYKIDSKNPNSKYFRNLGISYPNSNDVKNAKRAGKSPGGDIKIHGYRNNSALAHLNIKYPWTLGCIALTNKDMDELFEVIKIGTRIEIVP